MRTALVTGATASIWRVAGPALRQRPDSVDFVAADLAEVDDVRRLGERGLELGVGHIDILINNPALHPEVSTADQVAVIITR